MYKLKVKTPGKTYCKKFADMQEVFAEMMQVLNTSTKNLQDLKQLAKQFDTRFYLSICR